MGWFTIGLPAFVVVMMRLMPAWPKIKSVAHTLPYDTSFTALLQRGKPLPTDRWTGITAPVMMRTQTGAPSALRAGGTAPS